jgi:putative hydrolase of the HAD superfamily
MEKIKAVIFDWGGVLIEDPAPALHKYCANAFGVSVERYAAAFEKCINDFQTGTVTEQQFWVNMANHLNAAVPKVISLWSDAFATAYKPRPEMFALVSNLRKTGRKTAILSNTEMPVVKIIDKQICDYMDVTVLSCLEGIAKPGKEIYDLTLSRLDVTAQEAIFIDDKPENIEGAKRAGLKTIYFETMDKFKKELSGIFPNIV